MQRLPSLALLVLLTGLSMGNPHNLPGGDTTRAEIDNHSSLTPSDPLTFPSTSTSSADSTQSFTSLSKTSISSQTPTGTISISETTSTGTSDSIYTSYPSTSSSIDISSLISSLSSDIQNTQSTTATSLSSVSASSTSSAETAKTTTATIASSTSTSDSSTSQSSSSRRHHRDLVIALSTILSFFGLIALIFLTYFIIRRRQHSKTRPSTPITDTEIAQWRGTSMSPLTRPPSTPQSHHQRYHSFGEKAPLKGLPTSLEVTRAPNSRSGLTDETVPGDEPFLGKRRPTKLVKHSYGASVSKSVRSEEERPTTWYDDDAVLQRSSRPKGADKEENI